MAEEVRRLLPAGIERFKEYLADARSAAVQAPPTALLRDPATSEPFEVRTQVETQKFAGRFEFGSYLAATLGGLDRRQISRDAGLWTWLALYFFDQLCPPDSDGTRKLLSDEAYVIPYRYDFQGYYRHLVRTPWLVYSDHGEFAKVLLVPRSDPAARPLSVRGEIVEQLASRQSVLGNPTIIKAAYKMYFDIKSGRPRRGSGGSGGGSPRRLAQILQQLDLTFDLNACNADRVLALLPREFARWSAG
jgi:hypothetical protein